MNENANPLSAGSSHAEPAPVYGNAPFVEPRQAKCWCCEKPQHGIITTLPRARS